MKVKLSMLTINPSIPRVPLLYSQTRAFDRKKYFAAKAISKALTDKENVEMSDLLQTFKTYTLGEPDKPITIHCQLPKPDDITKTFRGDVTFPKPISSSQDSKDIILVFAKGEQAALAKKLGAHIVGDQELIEQILTDSTLVFNKVLATKEVFPSVIKIAKFLGPKGLMPSPARGTVSDDVEGMMKSLKATTKYEMESGTGLIHLEVAKTGWSDEEIVGNITSFLESVVKARPSKVKISKFIEAVIMSSTITPGFILPRKKLIADFNK